jgi:hypothetical protein
MTEKRIHMAVEQELEAKGLKKTEGAADLLVITYAASTTDARVDAPSFAGLPNTWTGWSAATTSRNSFNGSLKVDLIDSKTTQLVWWPGLRRISARIPTPRRPAEGLSGRRANVQELSPPKKKMSGVPRLAAPAPGDIVRRPKPTPNLNGVAEGAVRASNDRTRQPSAERQKPRARLVLSHEFSLRPGWLEADEPPKSSRRPRLP